MWSLLDLSGKLLSVAQKSLSPEFFSGPELEEDKEPSNKGIPLVMVAICGGTVLLGSGMVLAVIWHVRKKRKSKKMSSAVTAQVIGIPVHNHHHHHHPGAGGPGLQPTRSFGLPSAPLDDDCSCTPVVEMSPTHYQPQQQETTFTHQQW